MNKKEFEVLDELYFLVSFDDLQEALNYDRSELRDILKSLVRKKWVKCYKTVNEDIEWDQVDFENLFDKYHYLASKEGLIAHNSR